MCPLLRLPAFAGFQFKPDPLQFPAPSRSTFANYIDCSSEWPAFAFAFVDNEWQTKMPTRQAVSGHRFVCMYIWLKFWGESFPASRIVCYSLHNCWWEIFNWTVDKLSIRLAVGKTEQTAHRNVCPAHRGLVVIWFGLNKCLHYIQIWSSYRDIIKISNIKLNNRFSCKKQLKHLKIYHSR